ncbi:MAG TPA: GNAT family N-acetyltransferase [Chthoniobacterales bacterium]|nr:GNAT family N-acetyltransferase [Chthoniobacterales bacterium]
MELITKRLRLRLWRDEDLPAFADLNSDPRVMRYMLKRLDRAESDAFAERIKENFARNGFGLWAVEVIGIADFIGFTGLSVPRFEAHFTPCVEIAWRLAFDYWGHGYATEAACAARDYGFRQLGLREIVSFTVTANQRSRKVMERIGMTHFPEDDFHHPLLPEGHPLRYHVLYRLGRPVL